MKLCVLQLGTGCIFLKIGINNSWNHLKKARQLIKVQKKIFYRKTLTIDQEQNVGHWKTHVFASCGSFYQSIHLRVGSQLDTTFAVGLYKAR